MSAKILYFTSPEVGPENRPGPAIERLHTVVASVTDLKTFRERKLAEKNQAQRVSEQPSGNVYEFIRSQRFAEQAAALQQARPPEVPVHQAEVQTTDLDPAKARRDVEDALAAANVPQPNMTDKVVGF